MEKVKELRMTLVILLVGLFFISGCFFSDSKTITFKTNGGSEVKNVKVKSGSKLEEAPVPTKDGFIFDGWYLDGEEYNFDKSVDEDITLVAKWIKDSLADSSLETNEEETTTENTTTSTTKVTTSNSTKDTTKSTTKKVTKKTTKKTTKKPTTTTTTSTTTTTTTVPKTVVTTTTTTVKVDPITPGQDTPGVTPIEPVTPIVKDIDISIEIVKEEIKHEETSFSLDTRENELTNQEEEEVPEYNEYIRLTRTKENVNVIRNIDDKDLDKLLRSDMNTWKIISNHAYQYDVISKDNVLELKGDKDVTSFTVVNDGESFIFDYDEVEQKWIIKYPTVSVGTGLDVIYYNNLETAISVSKKGDTIRLLADQDVKNNLKVNYPVIIEGDNYKITNTEGYLFNLENIQYESDDEFIINNLVVEVDSLIYVGKSKFTGIVLNNLLGNIKNNKIDKRENGEFENTSLLQYF